MSDFNPFTLYLNAIDDSEKKISHTEEFDRLLKRLNRVICDVHMASHGYEASPDKYIRVNNLGAVDPVAFTLPADDGTGGGVAIALKPGARINGYHYDESFNHLRERLRNILISHRSLPTFGDGDLTGMSAAIASMGNWTLKLSPNTEINPDSLPRWINTTNEDLGKHESSTLKFVANELVGKLPSALGQLQQAAYATLYLLNTNVHAVNILSHDTREAMQAAIKACENFSKIRILSTLKFIGTAIRITKDVETIWKGDAEKSASVAQEVAQWLAVDDTNITIKSPIYNDDTILSELESAIEKLDTAFLEAETSIRDNYIDIAYALGERYKRNMLTIDHENTSVDPYSDTISINWDTYSTIYKTDLPSTAKRFRSVQLERYNVRYGTNFSRSPKLGLGELGPANSFYDTTECIGHTLERLAESCDGIASGLKDFENTMKENDTESADDFRKITAKIDNYVEKRPKFPQSPSGS